MDLAETQQYPKYLWVAPQDGVVVVLRQKSVIISAYRSENLRLETCANSKPHKL